MLLPVLLLLMAMLAQPACLLYTRCVMQAAAAQGCRVLATSGSGLADYGDVRALVLRRLDAVPAAPIFHEGGHGGWTVTMTGSAQSGEVAVEIRTTARPLPFMGALASLVAGGGADGVISLEARVARASRPNWLEGGYGDWMSSWG